MPLHDGRKVFDPNKKSWALRFRLFFLKNKKKFRNFLIFILILIIIFFPTFSGQLIGDWVKDFIGTAINIIKTI